MHYPFRQTDLYLNGSSFFLHYSLFANQMQHLYFYRQVDPSSDIHPIYFPMPHPFVHPTNYYPYQKYCPDPQKGLYQEYFLVPGKLALYKDSLPIHLRLMVRRVYSNV